MRTKYKDLNNILYILARSNGQGNDAVTVPKFQKA